MTERTYEYVRGAHTLSHRIDAMLSAVAFGDAFCSCQKRIWQAVAGNSA